MMKKQRIISLILAVCLWTCLFSTRALAEEALIISEGVTTGADTVRLQSISATDKANIKSDIKNALKNLEEYVSVSKYNLTPEEAGDLYLETVYENPDLFYVQTAWAHAKKSEDKVERLVFVTKNTNGTKKLLSYADYVKTPAVLEEKREKVEAELHRIVSGIDARMSAAEKALSVHDWFALHYQYNMPAAQNGVLCEAHRVDGLFIDKTAVCQGYALGFLYVMQELGIPCRYIASESMVHAWNLVQIDGAWYHVDVTYDDPLYPADDSDMFGYVSHESFLRGNAGIRESTHEGWELPSDIREVSEEDFGGENPFWENMETGAHYLDGKWYYKKGDSIVKRGFSETEEETVKSISERWPYREGFFYSQTFFDIGIYDGRIYYNTPRDVRSIKPDGTDERILFSPVLSEDAEIYKILILEDTVYIGTAEEYTLVPERQEGMRLTDKISFVTEVKDGQLIITMTGRTDRDGIFALSAKADRRQEAFTCAPLIHGHELFKIDIPDTTQKEITLYVWDGLVPLVEPLTIFLEES